MNFVTLTSDIGHTDYLVGAVKAQLLQVNPDLQLVDVSHNISPFNLFQASYVCRGAFKNFPEFTFHLVLVNLFDQKPDNLLLVFHKNQYIMCADNGLLNMILEEKPDMVMGIPLDKKATKNTLYVTGLMARTVKRILDGESIQNIGVPDVNFREKNPLQPIEDKNYIEGQIIFIDNYENVIVNITRKQFETQRKNRKFKILFLRDEIIDQISESYADVKEGEKLAYFNSADYLEIAINKGNAAGLFGLEGFSDNTNRSSVIKQSKLLYQTVKVHFEEP
ncbi:MAG: S-adenosyl-l-methionine hydroxide adenosyltransferase family protein [Niabella sp.]